MNSLLGLCLCLVLVGVITAGAIGCIAPSSAGGTLPAVQVCKAEPLEQNEVDYALTAIGGNLPDIKVFEAEPLVLNDGDSALYTFVVKRATKIQVIEAGNLIKEINSPTLATLKGTVKGLTAYAIQTGDSSTFNAVLVASNGSGEVQEELTLSFATPAQPAGQSGSTDNQTEPRSPKWLPQLSLPPISTLSTSATPGSEPVFFKCPSGCEYCLKPEDAAGRGFNQRCSEEPCYYSPDNQQKWYCYKPTPGWCCQGGKVNPATRDECAQIQGFWSTNQNEAIQACQPIGWCCRDGNLYQATKDQCAQMGGTYWSTNQNEAMRACQPIGWCCRDGNLYQATQAQCAQVGGSYWSTNQAEAMRACQPVLCWCCSGGKVYQTTQAQCAQTGGTCYATQSQATAGCRLTTPTYR
jgi:hypothetical protein